VKIKAKRDGRTLPRSLAQGEVLGQTFDGYTFVVHMLNRDGRQFRVDLERHEADRIAQWITAELAKQRGALAELSRVTDQVFR